MNARPQNIFITGTSTGIGRACAIRLARQGFRVFAGVRTEADAHSIEAAGTDTPRGIRAVQIDVTDPSSIGGAVEKISGEVGAEGLTGLVNNAGICILGPAEFISLDKWRRQFDVNLFGYIAVTQAMLPLLRKFHAAHREFGARIVNIGSVSGEISTPLFGAYSASKFAVRALSDSLRIELRPEGIQVCLIIPGIIQSEIWRKERQSIAEINSDAHARDLYGRLIDNVCGYVFGQVKNAIPADRVAAAVENCLTSDRPKHRTCVGKDAVMGSLARKLLPDRWLDYLVARQMKVPR